MAIKFINDDFFSLRDFNRDEIDIFSMDERFKEYYYKIYSLYTELFLQYLVKKTRIKEIDDRVTNSNLNFVKIKEEDRDFYQEYCSDYLNYFYLRNNLHLYRLSNEQKDFLTNKLANEDYQLDDETEKFIESSFKLMIFECIDKEQNDKVININYGPFELGNFAPNNALVIGLRIDDENDNLTLSDDAWLENKMKQRKLINDLCQELASDIKEKVNCNCSIIEFNDYTVKKKSNVMMSEENSDLGVTIHSQK